ncbi:MAG: hypothetical protein CMO32_05440 [Variovorax sp.]|nr:hypothetical protein [Variovorax sp.]
MTNVEFVVDLMEHSQHGALIQAFVLQAIQVYASSVAKKSPAELDTPLVAGAAWHGCAMELCSKLNGYWVFRSIVTADSGRS